MNTKKLNLKKTEKLRLSYFGVDKGLDFLKNFEKFFNQNKDLKIVKNSHKNRIIQKFYLDFIVTEYFKCNLWYNNLLNSFVKTSNSSNDEDCYVMVYIFIQVFMITTSTFKVNDMDLDFLRDKVCSYFNLMMPQNAFENIKMTDALILGLESDKIIKISKFKNRFSILDNQMYYQIKFADILIPNVFCETEFDIKFSSNYALENLNSVIDYFISKIDYKPYLILLNFCKKYNFFDAESLGVFLNDYSKLSLLPLDCVLDPNLKHRDEIMLFFQRILMNKLILNQYCLSVVSLSFFENYFFTSLTKRSIMFQKFNPKLNLNPTIFC